MSGSGMSPARIAAQSAIQSGTCETSSSTWEVRRSRQQPAVVAIAGVDEVGVDAEQRHPFKRRTGAPHDPGLHGAVVEVIGLTWVADLTSTMLATPPVPQQQIGAHQNAAVAERGLEQGEIAAARQQARRLTQGLAELRRLDQHHPAADRAPRPRPGDPWRSAVAWRAVDDELGRLT